MNAIIITNDCQKCHFAPRTTLCDLHAWPQFVVIKTFISHVADSWH